MQIIQISDLHITESTEVSLCKQKIDKMYEAVKDSIDKTSTLIMCVCGDIIDSSSKNGYENAEIVFNYIKDKFGDFSVLFEFVPGNHDMIADGFDEYDRFIGKFIEGDKYTFNNTTVAKRNCNGVSLV